MGDADEHKCDLSGIIDPSSLSYEKYLAGIKTGKPDFDKYLRLILDNRRQQETSQDYDLASLKDKKIDDFLRNYAGISYADFVNGSHPENIEDDSYGLIKRKSIRRSLFVSRSRLYLQSLCDFEEQGGDISVILEDIRSSYVPLVKQTKGTEPTFEAIYRLLKR